MAKKQSLAKGKKKSSRGKKKAKELTMADLGAAIAEIKTLADSIKEDSEFVAAHFSSGEDAEEENGDDDEDDDDDDDEDDDDDD